LIDRPFTRRGFAALAFLALAAFSIPAAAALDAPAGWRKESFAFPLAYAPSLPYQGTEQVRFSPSWSRFSDEAGFSYVALWDIRPAPLEPEALERALGVYFDGLMNNVAIGRKIEALVPQTAVVLHPLDAPTGWTEAYAGEIHTWNAFSKAEDLVLKVEVTKRACGADRVQVFFAFAKAPRSAAPWKPLRAIRASTTCAS
jgi:hypothetical protein